MSKKRADEDPFHKIKRFIVEMLLLIVFLYEVGNFGCAKTSKHLA